MALRVLDVSTVPVTSTGTGLKKNPKWEALNDATCLVHWAEFSNKTPDGRCREDDPSPEPQTKSRSPTQGPQDKDARPLLRPGKECSKRTKVWAVSDPAGRQPPP